MKWITVCLLVLAPFPVASGASLAGTAADDPLVGLWHARRSDGPELRGTLSLFRAGKQWRAELAGYSTEVLVHGSRLTGVFPDDRGTLRASYDDATGGVVGHWVQPPAMQVGGRMASPVRFRPAGPGRWLGDVEPRESEYTFYLKIFPREDGSLGAFLRNPDRNLGVFYNLDRVERDGDRLRLFGRFFRNEDEQLLLEGTVRQDGQVLSIFIPGRGGSYDFTRSEATTGGFYARAAHPRPYTYRPPPAGSDGWPTGTLDEAGLDFGPLKAMIEQEIDPAAADVHAHYVHGVLIARHGKLVFEEYFHGFHRDEPHDTRSASKSLTSLLIGAAIHAGVPLSLETPVYATLLPEAGDDLDLRKRAMALGHLLTMASGLYCDDNDGDAPGSEDRMQSQEEQPDWYAYTLAVPMANEPGEAPVYCSASPNLAGALLAAKAGRPLEELFDALIAGPLEIDRYHLFLQPTGEPYMGGGIHWLPRDFMKLGQVVLDGGTWKGRRIVSESWARRSTSSLVDLRGRGYGYQWWVRDYPYDGGTVQAFFAGGNGGQIVVGLPELDLVIAFYGGNYSDRILFKAQDVLIPEYILPAVHSSAD